MPLKRFVLLAVIAGSVATGEARTIHTERSLYQNIVVTQSGDLRCLKFTARRNERRQSCMDVAHPRRLVFSYTKMMLVGVLLVDDPDRILVVGLGGGTLPTLLTELFPSAQLTVVEIDPAVTRVAERFFGYAANAHSMVVEQDARVFGRRAASRGEHFDFILLDAFNSDYIPEHLMTREYLEETRRLLAADGVLVSNTFAVSRLYDHESVTYEKVFGPFLNLRTPGSANRIIVAKNGVLPSDDSLTVAAARWRPALEPYGVPITRYPDYLSRDRDWDHDARALTDQYSPANLLNALP